MALMTPSLVDHQQEHVKEKQQQQQIRQQKLISLSCLICVTFRNVHNHSSVDLTMKAGESTRRFIRRSAFTPGPSNPQPCELVKTEETSDETTSSSVGHVASADAENEGFLKKAIKKEKDEDEDFLLARESSIPDAGVGVFNKGDMVDRDEALDSGYYWAIHKSKRCEKNLDATREMHAIWMRYVNCARNNDEQNLGAFQYHNEILYRSCRPVKPEQELLLSYGENYAEDLGITFNYIYKKSAR